MKEDKKIFENVYQALPVPVLIAEANAPDFTIVDVNEAFCKATLRKKESLIGRNIFEAFPDNPDDGTATGVAVLKANMCRAVDTGQAQELTDQKYEIKNEEDGTFELKYWHLISTPIFDERGSIAYVINTPTDVTNENLLKAQTAKAERDRAKSLQELESVQEEIVAADRSNALLHAIIDTAQAGIFLFTPIYDDDGKIIDFRFTIANKMLAAYVGQSPENVTGALGSKWFPGYKTNGLFDKYSHTALTGITNRFEFHYDEDGIDVWLDIMSTKVDDGVLVTFTDYTAMKNLQRRLEEHVAELRNSNANLEQFAYIASHDLQEPLRKVKSFGDMLQNRYGDALGPGGADLIGRMQSAAARMSTLIDDLLTYSRASVKPTDMKVIDADHVLEGVLFDLERSVQQQKAVIKRDKLLPVAGQPTQIGQVFLNIISNALKFHKPDAPPEISISAQAVKGRDAGIVVPAHEEDRNFQLITISDNGIGFDNTYRERIFQIFQRLHSRSEYPGSGVGLSIVKKVVENHGGYIDATSEPGKGATFFILLPLVANTEA